MRVLISLFTLFLMSCSTVNASCKKRPTIVAVIDTGFGYNDQGHQANLCNFGHKDFSMNRVSTKNYATVDPVPVDTNGHGTNVAGLIDQYAKQGGAYFCLVIIKYYDIRQSSKTNLMAEIEAIRYAANIHADVINMSGGGPETDEQENKEIKKFLSYGGIFVAAAGNEGQNIDKSGYEYYPARYDDRILVVGNLEENNERNRTSNYGDHVKFWEHGTNATAFGLTRTGTSQATAIHTGKIVANKKITCDSEN
jgi:subtilisin family serine protease